MRRFLAILAILLPLAVMAAQAGSNPLTVKDPPADTGRLLSIGSPDTHRPDPQASFQEGHGPLLLAAMNGDPSGKDMKNPEKASALKPDLRYVDWDSVKGGKKAQSGKNGKNGNGKNGEGGDESGNGDEDKNTSGDEEKDEDKKDEEGGWDRLWDAAKLG